MSRREKLYHLHDILRQRRTPVSRQHLMEELGCSQATLYRLIAELRDVLGAPLEQDPESRHYFYDRSLAGNFELPGLWISPEELQALLTARQILSNVQPGLLQDELDQVGRGHLDDAEDIEQLLRSLRARLPQPLRKRAVEEAQSRAEGLKRRLVAARERPHAAARQLGVPRE